MLSRRSVHLLEVSGLGLLVLVTWLASGAHRIPLVMLFVVGTMMVFIESTWKAETTDVQYIPATLVLMFFIPSRYGDLGSSLWLLGIGVLAGLKVSRLVRERATGPPPWYPTTRTIVVLLASLWLCVAVWGSDAVGIATPQFVGVSVILLLIGLSDEWYTAVDSTLIILALAALLGLAKGSSLWVFPPFLAVVQVGHLFRLFAHRVLDRRGTRPC